MDIRKRFDKGKVSIIEKRCPECNHRKAKSTLYLGIVKCTKCGYRHDKGGE